MENNLDFKIFLKNERSSEIHSSQLNPSSILTISSAPYISKYNSTQQISTASIKKGSIWIEHHIIMGTQLLPITIKSLHSAYILIVCLEGNIAYNLKKDPASIIRLNPSECIFLFAQKGIYLATPSLYPTEILTICIHPDLIQLISSNHAGILEFIYQHKTTFLFPLQVVSYNQVFLNKLKKLITIDSINSNNQLLKYVPMILTAYKILIILNTQKILYKRIVENSIKLIHKDLQGNQIPQVNSLAKRNSTNVSTLQLAFKSILGSSVHKKIKSATFSRVAELLIFSDRTLLDLAMTFGYSDVNTLNRIFKKSYGQTLGSYRKKHRNRPF